MIESRLKAIAHAACPAALKLLGQFVIGGTALAWLFFSEHGMPLGWPQIRNRLSIPFLAFAKHPILLPSGLYFAFALVVVVAMSNAVNLTDGLDGLAIGPVMINAGAYMIWAYVAGLVLFGRHMAAYLDIPGILEMGELSVYGASVLGAGIGFLWYNTYPAQVFMGDVGSLSLGGGLGMMAVLTKNELLSLVLGGVFVIEMLSVVTQVISFQLFGKRVFLMAPIHHHFEKKGWPEPRIIVRFWIISVLLALISLASLKVR